METTEQHFLRTLIRVNQLLRRHYDDKAQALGLTMSRARVISQVARTPGVTQTELARHLEIETPSVKRLLDGLEAGGFVQRCAVEGDRRANGIFLTARAQAEAGDIVGFLEKLAAEIFADVDPADVQAGTRLLDRILSKLGD
ncbi:MarR family winged helix-turn-helix transcriptional regulator [Phaeovulum sp. W22_SRMD_FR3]|uniref:MarR family winged helix-turn-helix transcriptional regulator n=1 Tax=Phaeovulum sp. W22_SRMD_FR3 TaxID=3240274 RepID=UPI003F9E4A81